MCIDTVAGDLKTIRYFLLDFWTTVCLAVTTAFAVCLPPAQLSYNCMECRLAHVFILYGPFSSLVYAPWLALNSLHLTALRSPEVVQPSAHSGRREQSLP